jgi:general stress protein CsbA
VTRLTKDVLPLTWVAFVIAALSGGLLFASKAMTYGHNFFLQGKLVLLVVAGLNMALFHVLVSRDVERWGSTPHTTPLPAKIAGACSLCLWVAVVAFGRWIGFTLHPTLGAS